MYKVELVAPGVITIIMIGGDEVQDETQGPQLTNEDIEEIKEKVNEEEEIDLVVVLLKKIIDTVMIEELFEINRKMNQFRRVLSKGVLKFAEGHADDTAKMDQFADSFRTAWKVYKKDEDKEKTMDTFMKAMGNELWFNEECPLCCEDTKA